MQDFLSLPISGTIQSIQSMPDCCQQLMSVTGFNGVTGFTVSQNTYIPDQTRLVPGMAVTAFYDGNAPVPLIYPPRYGAVAVCPVSQGETVILDYFDRSLLSSDKSLRLNVSRETQITTANGQDFPCSPAGHYLLVYYNFTTRSIPAQTTPRRIIVMCGTER